MIRTFSDKATEHVFEGARGRETRMFPPDLLKVARRKLDYLNVARRLDDLRLPPGNRLEALQGELKGLHSIRINDQWRIVFRWQDGDCYEVRICDYH